MNVNFTRMFIPAQLKTERWLENLMAALILIVFWLHSWRSSFELERLLLAVGFTLVILSTQSLALFKQKYWTFRAGLMLSFFSLMLFNVPREVISHDWLLLFSVCLFYFYRRYWGFFLTSFTLGVFVLLHYFSWPIPAYPFIDSGFVMRVLFTLGVLWVFDLYRRRMELFTYHRTKKLNLKSYYDDLSGLLNRRGAERRLASELKKLKGPAHLVVFQLSDFKRINLNHGYACGDHLIKNFSRLIKKYLPSRGVFSRWGGGQFLYFLPGSSGEKIQSYSKQLIKECNERLFFHDGQWLKLEPALGTAELQSANDWQSALKKAENLLLKYSKK